LDSEIASRKCGPGLVFLLGFSVSGFSLAIARCLLDELLRAGRALLLYAPSYLRKRTGTRRPGNGRPSQLFFKVSGRLHDLAVDLTEFLQGFERASGLFIIDGQASRWYCSYQSGGPRP
jgi:hypothetical protein